MKKALIRVICNYFHVYCTDPQELEHVKEITISMTNNNGLKVYLHFTFKSNKQGVYAFIRPMYKWSYAVSFEKKDYRYLLFYMLYG